MSAARTYGAIAITALLLALLPTVVHSNTLINALVTAMIIALAAQGWNLLAGYGGQFSFGHAAFFGAGAYGNAILQTRYGINAYAAMLAATVIGAIVGAIIGYLSFRSGLRGSYFALITLAFAEVFRIIANATPVTGGAAGTLIKLQVSAANFQFASRAIYFWIILALVTAVMLLMRGIERSCFGAYLVAVRENENAAAALGVDTLDVKLKAITLSAAMTALAGAFYVQYFLFVDFVDCLRHLDFRRGAVGADHRWIGHRVRSVAGRPRAAFSWRIRQSRSRAVFPASIWRCSVSSWC